MFVSAEVTGTARPVSIRDLHHDYGGGPVLQDVFLEITSGESLALLGPSGCGKTTLLRCVAGLERPVRGKISIGDDVVSGEYWVPPERRGVGMVFQDWALFPHLTVGANVAYGLPRPDRNGPKVRAALDLVGLADMAERSPDTLSGGQQQRVALARALAPEPSVLLLDEPFSNLDTSLRVEVRSEVHRLLSDLGITAVFVTHDQEEAFVLGDRVAVMTLGRIEQVDTPHGLYTRPANRGVAEFVGSASMMRCDASGAAASGPLGELPLREAQRGPVDVLLRPEQLRLVDGTLATVDLVEFYGHDAMVYVDIEGTVVRVRTAPEISVKRGDRVGVEFVGTEVQAFPA